MSRSININPEMVRKHLAGNQNARFYPIPNLCADFDNKDYAELAQHSNTVLLPKKLSVYVHAPEWLGSCNIASGVIDAYWESLRHEIALQAKLYGDDRIVSQIIFCGSILDHFTVRQIAELLDELAAQFHLDLPSNMSLAIELNASARAAELIKDLRNLGFSQFHFSTHTAFQAVDISTDNEQTHERNDCYAVACAEVATLAGSSATVEIRICEYGMQGMDYHHTLKQLVNAGVPLINAHSFAVPCHLQRVVAASDFHSKGNNKRRTEIINSARLLLTSAGYHHIGSDHYALPSQATARAQSSDSLHLDLLGYSAEQDTDWVGIGLGAVSKFDTGMARNTMMPKQYLQALQDRVLPIAAGLSMSDQEKLSMSLMKQIMCRREVDLSQTIGRLTGTSSQRTLSEYFVGKLDVLRVLQNDGLLKITADGFRITQLGRYFAAQIAAQFCGSGASGNDGKVVHFTRSH